MTLFSRNDYFLSRLIGFGSILKTASNETLVWNTAADPADPPETVSSTAARNHPTTRAGDQDDVSSTNSFK